jgi:hypothetical protein
MGIGAVIGSCAVNSRIVHPGADIETTVAVPSMVKAMLRTGLAELGVRGSVARVPMIISAASAFTIHAS